MSKCFAVQQTKHVYKVRQEVCARLIAQITTAGVREQLDELFRWHNTPEREYLDYMERGVISLTK